MGDRGHANLVFNGILTVCAVITVLFLIGILTPISQNPSQAPPTDSRVRVKPMLGEASPVQPVPAIEIQDWIDKFSADASRVGPPGEQSEAAWNDFRDQWNGKRVEGSAIFTQISKEGNVVYARFDFPGHFEWSVSGWYVSLDDWLPKDQDRVFFRGTFKPRITSVVAGSVKGESIFSRYNLMELNIDELRQD